MSYSYYFERKVMYNLGLEIRVCLSLIRMINVCICMMHMYDSYVWFICMMNMIKNIKNRLNVFWWGPLILCYRFLITRFRSAFGSVFGLDSVLLWILFGFVFRFSFVFVSVCSFGDSCALNRLVHVIFEISLHVCIIISYKTFNY